MRTAEPQFRQRFSQLTAGVGAETRGFARDSVLLSLADGLTTLGLMAQISLITHSLGIREYGVFALVVSSVSIIQRIFNLQVGHTAIAYSADTVGSDERRTAGIFQFAYMVDALAGALAFAVVLGLAPLVGPRVIGPHGATLLVLFAVTLVISTVDMTSLSLLRMFGAYRLILLYTLIRETTRVIALLVALTSFHSLKSVIVALITVDACAGIVGVVLATRVFEKHSSGVRLARPALSAVSDIRWPMFRMMLQTNVVSYTRLVAAQGPTIVVGIIRGPFEAGVLKVSLAIAAGIAKLADPLWTAAIPRFARLWSAGELNAIRRVVAQSTVAVFVLLGSLAALTLVFRDTLLGIIGGPGASAGSLVVTFAVLSQAVNSILFWNAPLLIASKKASLVALNSAAAALVLLVLLIPFTRHSGAAGAALALLIYNLLLNFGLSVSALRRMSPARGIRLTAGIAAIAAPPPTTPSTDPGRSVH